MRRQHKENNHENTNKNGGTEQTQAWRNLQNQLTCGKFCRSIRLKNCVNHVRLSDGGREYTIGLNP